MILNNLKTIGLSDNEARTYIAMLELGPATMLEISAKAGINRPTAYVQIESLKQKGLVSTQVKGKKTLFLAESPAHLETLLERQEKDIEFKKEELNKIFPELSTLFSLGDSKPVVRFFEGIDGVHKVEDIFLKSGATSALNITSLDDVLKVFPKLLSEKGSRVGKKISTRVLYTSKDGAILPDNDEANLRKAKYIDYKKFPYSLDIAVFGDNVAIISYKGRPSSTIITDKAIADSFRSIFELVWSLT